MNTNTKQNRFGTDYNASAYQCWANGQRSTAGADKAATLFWCVSENGYDGMRLGFETAQERAAFCAQHGGASVIDAPQSGDRAFSVQKNLGPYTCSISF